MRREERVTVQGPVKEQQPDGMSHRGVLDPPPPPGDAELLSKTLGSISMPWERQQTGNALHTHATEHGFEPRSRLACRGAVAFLLFWDARLTDPMGGVGL